MSRLRTTIPGRLAIPALALAALLAACASDDAESGGARPSSDGNRATGGASDGAAAAPTIRSFPPETQAFMKAGLQQFSRKDPKWDSTRREWLAMGDRETQFLVQMMWGALIGGQTGNSPEVVERSRHELALIGEPSIPLMAGVLSAGEIRTTRDPATGEDRPVKVDDLQRREASEVLSIIGAPAVPAVIEALGAAESKAGRRYAIVTLGNMGDRAGEAGARTLASWAANPDDVLRVDAVHAMRTYHDSATETALLAALEDADELVREKAADSLAARGDRRMVSVIRGAAARAQGEGRIGEARRMERAADVLEKRGR